MVKFRSNQFIENLNWSIDIYNTGYRKNTEFKLPIYDKEKGINEKVLKKINVLSFREIQGEMTQEELIECNEDFSLALKYMNLKRLDIAFIDENNENLSPKLDVSFITNLPDNVQSIELVGCDLSNVPTEIFSKFNELKYIDLSNSNISDVYQLINKLSKDTIECIMLKNTDLSKIDLNLFSNFENLDTLILNGCNINNPEFIEKLDKSCLIDISNNNIDSLYYKMFGNLMEIYPKLQSKEYKDVRYFLDEKLMMLRNFEHINSVVDLSKFDDFEINASAKFDISNTNISNIVNKLNKLTNAHLLAISGNDNYKILREKYGLSLPTKMVIEDASELSCDDLEKNTDIKTIKIVDNLQLFCTNSSYYTYTREEYIAIREKIDDILSKLPQRPENTSQKQIFTDIYKLIAQSIEYDMYAISEEGKENKELQRTCRNLYGGLIDGKCVCAGYAEILRNICSCVGIDAVYIAGEPSKNTKFKKASIDGHAWNCVNLDGQWYNADITYDRNQIILEKFPLMYFLKSTKDFHHEFYNNLSAHGHEEVCVKSISDSEQIELLTGEKVNEDDLIKTKKELSKNYLSGFTLSQLSKSFNSIHVQRFLKLLKEQAINKDDQKQK